MARTQLTVQEPTRQTPITNPTANAADNANGNSFTNDGKTFMRITNGSGGDLTVTIDVPTLYDTDLEVPDRTYVISNGDTICTNTFSSMYNQSDNGNTDQVLVDWSTGTSVTVEVIRITHS